MTNPQPFICSWCHRDMPPTRGHYALGPGPVLAERVICSRCVFAPGGTIALHARFWPECPTGWHDTWDHPSLSGTRAGLRWATEGYVIPEWPTRFGQRGTTAEPAERLNAAAARPARECRLCTRPAEPGSDWCGTDDAAHGHARQVVGAAPPLGGPMNLDPLGIRPEALPAWHALAAALAESGPVPCAADPDGWTARPSRNAGRSPMTTTNPLASGPGQTEHPNRRATGATEEDRT